MMITNFLSGFDLVRQGFSLVFRPGVRRFVVIPLLINIAVFSLAIWFGIATFASLLNSFLGWVPSWLGFVQWLLWPFAVLTILLIVYYGFAMIANLIAAPFNSLLAERIEHLLEGKPSGPDPDYGGLIAGAGRTIASEAKKIVYQLGWLVVLLLLTVIPGVNFIAPMAWAWFGAHMLSIEYVDYPMGNHNLYFRDVRRALREDRWTALGLGSGIMLMTLIPVLNFLAMPVGVASGTVYFVGRYGRKALREPVAPVVSTPFQ